VLRRPGTAAARRPLPAPDAGLGVAARKPPVGGDGDEAHGCGADEDASIAPATEPAGAVATGAGVGRPQALQPQAADRHSKRSTGSRRAAANQ